MTTTFLQGVQDARKDAGISGSGPTTVAGQVELYDNLVRWYKKAWVDIQNSRRDWLFMWKQFSFTTTAGTRSYGTTKVTDLRTWGTDQTDRPIYCYLTASGKTAEFKLVEYQFSDFKFEFMQGEQYTTQGLPSCYTVSPDNNLYIGPIPDASYTITGDYHKTAQGLAADADVILLCDDYVDVIKWATVRRYGAYSQDGGLYQDADNEYSKIMNRMLVEQLPMMKWGACLA